MARKPKLGTGKRFSSLVRSISRRGKVRNPRAVAAAIGRKKYGKRRMAKMAVRGRKRRSRRK
jgi:hypothetical protein